MEIIYNIYKGTPVSYNNDVLGVVCGYCDNNLLMATKQKPLYSFRLFDKKEHFIEPEFKSDTYRYCYVSESYLEKCANI
jgi:hypothetical protein